MTKEASYQIDCACAKNLCQNFGRAMALPALPVPPGLMLASLALLFTIATSVFQLRVQTMSKAAKLVFFL